ncbi:hypothetical protein OfM1_18820 [Lactovum odontotermitis]
MKKNNFGRPKSEDPRNRLLTIRLTENEMNNLNAYAKKVRSDKAKVVRQLISGLENSDEN